jgi:hypothetical protein
MTVVSRHRASQARLNAPTSEKRGVLWVPSYTLKTRVLTRANQISSLMNYWVYESFVPRREMLAWEAPHVTMGLSVDEHGCKQAWTTYPELAHAKKICTHPGKVGAYAFTRPQCQTEEQSNDNCRHQKLVL